MLNYAEHSFLVKAATDLSPSSSSGTTLLMHNQHHAVTPDLALEGTLNDDGGAGMTFFIFCVFLHHFCIRNPDSYTRLFVHILFFYGSALQRTFFSLYLFASMRCTRV